MKFKQKKNEVFRIVPKNDKKCVWMELGIVSYKICERNFECETCPLDQGLRGSSNLNQQQQLMEQPTDSNTKSQKADPSLERLFKLKLDEHRFVHPGHCWIEVLSKNQVKIGIDDIVATTLGSIDNVILPLPGEKITKGASCGQIIQFEHIFSIVSPLSGWVMKVNQELTNFPNKVILDPLNKGWMIIVKPENLDQDLKYCRSGDALYSWYLKEFKWLESSLAEGFRHNSQNIGMTLNDGGEISRNLRNYLPKERYRRLVLSLLGIPESNK